MARGPGFRLAPMYSVGAVPTQAMGDTEREYPETSSRWSFSRARTCRSYERQNVLAPDCAQSQLSAVVQPTELLITCKQAIADVVEAIIGAALLSGGEKLAFSVAKILGFDVPRTCDWLDVVSYAPRREIKLQESHNREILEGVMKIIGVPLENPELLIQSMVSNHIIKDYVTD
jgi:hypothetical protein